MLLFCSTIAVWQSEAWATHQSTHVEHFEGCIPLEVGGFAAWKHLELAAASMASAPCADDMARKSAGLVAMPSPSTFTLSCERRMHMSAAQVAVAVT